MEILESLKTIALFCALFTVVYKIIQFFNTLHTCMTNVEKNMEAMIESHKKFVDAIEKFIMRIA